MPQVDPYKSQYDYEAEPSTSGALVFRRRDPPRSSSHPWCGANFKPAARRQSRPAPITQPATADNAFRN